MSRTPDLGQSQAAALTPRRRGAMEPAATTPPAASTPAHDQQTPILIRLPDLHPSPVTDAAVRRLEKQVQSKKPASQAMSPSSPPRRESPATERTPPLPPSSKPKSPAADWNNRIIISTFVLTLLASGYMVVQRAVRDQSESRSRLPVSSAGDLDPIPSHRIDRGSFQANARKTDLGAAKTRQARNSASVASRIESVSQSDSGYDVAPAAYQADEMEFAPQADPATILKDTYEFVPPGAHQGADDEQLYQPRSLRLRNEPE